MSVAALTPSPYNRPFVGRKSMPTNVCPAVTPAMGTKVPTDGVAGSNDTKVEPDSAYACVLNDIALLPYRGVRHLIGVPRPRRAATDPILCRRHVASRLLFAVSIF